MNIDLKKYNINLALIKQHIDEAAVKKNSTEQKTREVFTKDMLETYSKFAEDKMGIKFHDVTLFITALTHRSYVNEHKK